MILSTSTLRWYSKAAQGTGHQSRTVREREVIDSHLLANAEIVRLRSALQTMLGTLNAIDNNDFDKAIRGVMKLEGLT